MSPGWGSCRSSQIQMKFALVKSFSAKAGCGNGSQDSPAQSCSLKPGWESKAENVRSRGDRGQHCILLPAPSGIRVPLKSTEAFPPTLSEGQTRLPNLGGNSPIYRKEVATPKNSTCMARANQCSMENPQNSPMPIQISWNPGQKVSLGIVVCAWTRTHTKLGRGTPPSYSCLHEFGFHADESKRDVSYITSEHLVQKMISDSSFFTSLIFTFVPFWLAWPAFIKKKNHPGLNKTS